MVLYFVLPYSGNLGILDHFYYGNLADVRLRESLQLKFTYFCEMKKDSCIYIHIHMFTTKKKDL